MHHKRLINIFKKHLLIYPALLWGAYFLIEGIRDGFHFPSFSLDMNSGWAEFTALIMAVVFVTGLLVVIAIKWRFWDVDTENPTVQITNGMKIFG